MKWEERREQKEGETIWGEKKKIKSIENKCKIRPRKELDNREKKKKKTQHKQQNQTNNQKTKQTK